MNLADVSIVDLNGDEIIVLGSGIIILQCGGEGLTFGQTFPMLTSPHFQFDEDGVRVGFFKGVPVFRAVREEEYRTIVEWMTQDD